MKGFQCLDSIEEKKQLASVFFSVENHKISFKIGVEIGRSTKWEKISLYGLCLRKRRDIICFPTSTVAKEQNVEACVPSMVIHILPENENAINVQEECVCALKKELLDCYNISQLRRTK